MNILGSRQYWLMSLVLLFALPIAKANEVGVVQYQLTVTDPDHHLANIEVTFPEVAPGKFTVKLPAWRTGKYKILNLANGISYLQAFDGAMQPLSVSKVNKNSWQVEVKKRGKLTIGYQLYANQLTDRARHLDNSHLFLDAAAGFIFNDTYRMSPVKVSLTVPKGWKSRSGMEKTAAHTFKAANYDVLVDSPIESGLHKFRQFKVDDRQYELVVWGEGNYDLDAIIEDLKKLDGAAKEFWPAFPYQRYVYMVHVAPGLRGATEHLNSTIIHSSPYRFKKRKDYIGFVQIAAHEFVHTWNVKHYRPAGITPYDYSQENYTPSLWIAEGSTSYLQNLLGVRAGTISSKEFLQSLAKSINSYMHTPGRQRMSVAQASFDAWIGHTNDDRLNNNVSIYQEGMLVTLVLDYEIRKRTDNKKSIADLHRALYNRVSKQHKGYRESEVLSILKSITGSSFNDFWRNYVHYTDPLPLKEALAYYGLEFKAADKKEKPWSGLKIKQDNGFARIIGVERDSPAWKAGLATGDLIISQQNQQASGDLIERLEDYSKGKKVVINYFRKNKLYKTQLQLVKNPFAKQKIVPKEGINSTISDRFKSWTGQDLSKVSHD